jgi:toluene monooxygenase electron transfer component
VPGIVGARANTMVNFDHRTERLSVGVKNKPAGAVSEWLFGDGVEGTRLGLVAPLGHATFHPGQGKHVLCIAGGSGIAGMMSILSLACQEGHFAAWDGHGFFGVRTARDGFFLDELEAFRAQYPARLTVTVALSDEDVPASLAAAYPGFAFARGFVHAVAGEHMKGRFADVRAYVAGPPPMVDASLRLLLREARLPPADIRYDKFS